MVTALVVSGLLIAYVYAGYSLVLAVLTAFRRGGAHEFPAGHQPTVSVFLSALNEADVVVQRLENLLATTYPLDLLEVLVISDGSTDATAERVRSFSDRHPELSLRLFDLESNMGRAYAQNLVAREASGEILVATDAETVFTPDTIAALARVFSDPEIGVAGGRIVFRPRDTDTTGVGAAFGLYWRLESGMRRMESALGLGVKTGGPCTAYRRCLWQPIEEFEDVDQVVSLVARVQGFRTVYVEDAVCYELANASYHQETTQRARMTRKALLSISHRWGLKQARAYPAFSFALFSHKVLRLFSPVYLGAFALALLLLIARHVPWLIVVGAVAVLVLASWRGPGARFLAPARSLVASQVGMAFGIVGWLTGNASGSYVPTRAIRR